MALSAKVKIIKYTVRHEDELNACWNSVFSNLFGFNKCESVKGFICGLVIKSIVLKVIGDQLTRHLIFYMTFCGVILVIIFSIILNLLSCWLDYLDDIYKHFQVLCAEFFCEVLCAFLCFCTSASFFCHMVEIKWS